MRRNAIAPALLAMLVASGCNKPPQDQDMQDGGTTTAAMPTDFYTADPAAEVAGSDSFTTFPAAEPVTLTASPVADSAVNVYGMHVVAPGDTLIALARVYYNDQSRWKDIYAANTDRLNNPDVIFVGQELVIP